MIIFLNVNFNYMKLMKNIRIVYQQGILYKWLHLHNIFKHKMTFGIKGPWRVAPCSLDATQRLDFASFFYSGQGVQQLRSRPVRLGLPFSCVLRGKTINQNDGLFPELLKYYYFFFKGSCDIYIGYIYIYIYIYIFFFFKKQFLDTINMRLTGIWIYWRRPRKRTWTHRTRMAWHPPYGLPFTGTAMPFSWYAVEGKLKPPFEK